MTPIRELTGRGVSVWLDTLSRDLVDRTDGLDALISKFGVTGATTNPTIFAKAICRSQHYDAQLRAELDAGSSDPADLFLTLALEDVRRAAGLLWPLYEHTAGRQGLVSFQCTPDIVDDAAATVTQGLDLWRRLGAANAMIKVPATDAGIDAIEELTARGVNVNVTLLFALARHEQAIEAYLRGLERRASTGLPIATVTSVASFFVSRIDAKADARLPAASPQRGTLGIANARLAYDSNRRHFAGPRWNRLAELGARPQRPVWASTATKDPAYRDVVYLEQLALPETIITVPEATLRAFANHGDLDRETDLDPQADRRKLDAAPWLDAITRELEIEGVESFRASYQRVLGCIEARQAHVATVSPRSTTVWI